MDSNNISSNVPVKPKGRLTKVLLIIAGVLLISAGGVYSYMHYSSNVKKEPFSLNDHKGLYYVQKVSDQYYLYYQRPGEPSNAILVDGSSKVNPADYVGKIVTVTGKFTENDSKVFINTVNVKEE